jgi:protease IV
MKDLVHSIVTILRYIGRFFSLLRTTTLNLLFLAFCLVAIAAMFSSRSVDIKKNSILQLTLAGDAVEEKSPASPLSQFLEESLGAADPNKKFLLQDILDTIATATTDNRIKVILLKLDGLGAIGLDQIQNIGAALEKFKKTGKTVIAAEDFYTQKNYYLASFASTILLNPMGGVELHGFGTYPLYFHESLDKLLVNYHVFRVGQYKSAVEPFTRNSMSDEVRSQNSEWLNSLWGSYTADIQKRRELSNEGISTYINTISAGLAAVEGDTARLALKAGLVDRLLTREEVYSYLRDLTGTSSRDELELVATADYLRQVQPSYDYDKKSADKIGIIVAEGTILGGKQPPGMIGGDTLAEMIRDARKNENTKAVVLRINSGGGSAFASEIIRQELLELKKSGKPLVVSMGTMAASGGYWIAADADQIWAAPTTLTGSIGIFGAIPTFERSLEKLGIRSDGVGTTPLAAGLNLAQPLSPVLQESIQMSVENGYRKFLTIVGKGRKIDRQKLDSIAEGRVFSGTRALQIGLVDKLGSLEEAIASAAQLAGLTSYSAEYVGRPTSLREQFLQTLAGKIAAMVDINIGERSLSTRLYRLLQENVAAIFPCTDPQHIFALTLLRQPLL